MTAGRIAQLNVSSGGVPKRRIPSAAIGPLGLEGDGHRDPGHGGPERAVCLYSLELIEQLQREGHSIVPGSAGENVTVSGIDWAAVLPGSELRLGDHVRLEITRYTTPCVNIAGSFIGGKFARILQDQHPGESRVYARVLSGGLVQEGDAVTLVNKTPASAH